MNKLYQKGNYIYVEVSGATAIPYGKSGTRFREKSGNLELLAYNTGLISNAFSKRTIYTFDNPASWFDESGGKAYNATTLREFLETYTNFNPASGGSGAGSGTLFKTPFLIGDLDQSIYADGQKGTQDPDGIEGWYFRNSASLTNKINWYYINNFNITSSMTISTLTGGYAVIFVRSETVAPFLNFYTKRKNDGQDVSWYRSRVVYNDPNILSGYSGQNVVIYWGNEPDIYPDYPKLELPLDTFSTVGVQDADEEIFLASLSTSTNYAEGSFEFTAKAIGYFNDNEHINLPCVSHTDVSGLESRVTDLEVLSQFLIAADLGRYFRGYVSSQANMEALANPIDYNYVARTDTGTIWRYLSGSWSDTTITISYEHIADLDVEAAGYSNTHYIDLDGTNDFIDLDTGVNANVLDYTQSWALGFEVENVSTIQDSSYTTLWKRGNNEITLRKGGTNWGVYFFANGNVVAAANTWRQPEPGSKILFVCNGIQVKYYLYRPSNGEIYQTNMTLNQTNVTNHNNASGNLEIGKGGVKGSYWYGGINNALIMEGTSADIGANQKAEYFGGQDVTLMSFYEDIEDFLPLGEDVYPTVTGTKGVISGNLTNGTASDFVARP